MEVPFRHAHFTHGNFITDKRDLVARWRQHAPRNAEIDTINQRACTMVTVRVRFGRQPFTTNNNRIQRRYSRFVTISPQRREQSPTRTLKWPGHVEHIERLSRVSATLYEGTAQLLSLTELKSHLFELYFIGWTIKPMKEFWRLYIR